MINPYQVHTRISTTTLMAYCPLIIYSPATDKP